MHPGLLLAALGAMPLGAFQGLGEAPSLRSGRFDDPPTVDPSKELRGRAKTRIRSYSYPCPGYKKACGKTISGNKDRCMACANLKRADEQDLWMICVALDGEVQTGPWMRREDAFQAVRHGRMHGCEQQITPSLSVINPRINCWAQRVVPNGKPEYRGEDNPDRLP